MSFSMIRIGQGVDVHRLGPGRPLIIGGVRLEYELGAIAHSDGDVLAHAVIDALLGALALGDIGQRFPDSDPKWKDADSIAMLKSVSADIAAQGWKIVNLDCSILLEAPKIAARFAEMRARLAEGIGCSVDAVSVKATTAEKLGAIGSKQGIAAFCTVLLAGTR